jgi:carboxylesterase type B
MWSYLKNPAKQAKRFASQANCPTTPTSAMVLCLKKKDAKELVSIHAEIGDQTRPRSAVFLPTIEIEMNDGKSFLTQEPKKIIESGNFAKVPILSGVNDAEGLIFSSGLSFLMSKSTFSQQNINTILS